jgi:hypothetical protein
LSKNIIPISQVLLSNSFYDEKCYMRTNLAKTNISMFVAGDSTEKHDELRYSLHY